jgi:mRNA interferase RelE/StbE
MCTIFVVQICGTVSGMAGSYDVEIETSAAKQIQWLQRHEQTRVITVILALANDPRPAGCAKLAGTDSAYRVRVGVFRIIYVIDDGLLVVTVTRVGHRREVYR